MSEITESKEYKDLQAKLEQVSKDAATDKETSEEKMESLSSIVKEIKEDRDAQKQKLKAELEKKTTENATVDELKKLLVDSKASETKAIEERKTDLIKAKIVQAASAKGFLKNSKDQINQKLLFSEIDPSKYQLDDDGEVIGLDQKFDSLKESDGYMFPKSKKAIENLNENPKTIKGIDVSDEAFSKASPMDQVKIQQAKAAQVTEDNGNMLVGMGSPTKK